MKRLAILGASGHGKVVADAATAGGWSEIKFFDDAWPTLKRVGPWTVAGATNELLEHARDSDGVIVAIGDNEIRMAKLRQISALGAPLVSIVHPAAVISQYAAIGLGSVVFAGAVINAFAKLGAGCIVNTNATIEHDCVLGDGVHVSPGANLGGQVVVGDGTWIGIGASVRHSVSIGDGVVVGSGAAVVNDIVSGQMVVGVPARPMDP